MRDLFEFIAGALILGGFWFVCGFLLLVAAP